MTMMRLDWTYEGDSNINLSINITDSVAILSDDSGTGKTFMFEMLESYFVAKGIAYKKFDCNSENEDADWFIHGMRKANIVLLDNADLYMTKKLFNYLKSSDKQVIMSIKHTEKLGSFENCGFYTINYENNYLKTVRESCGTII